MRTIFRQLVYVLLAFFVAIFLLFLAVWLPNLALLRFMLFSDVFSRGSKLAVITGSWQWLGTNFTPVSAGLTVLGALLAGVNFSLLAYYFRRQITLGRAAGTSALGIVASFLGVGCSACGSFILSAVFGLGVGSALTARLPLAGQEFSWLGAAVLSLTAYLLIRKIRAPLAC